MVMQSRGIRWSMAILGVCVGSWALAGARELPVTAGLEARFDATAFASRRPGSHVAQWPDGSGNQRPAAASDGGPTYGEARTPAGPYTVSFHDVCGEALSFCYNPNGRDITVIGVARSRVEATEWPYYFKGFIGWTEVAGETPLALGSFNITQTVVSLSGYGEAGLSHTMSLAHEPATGFTINTVRLDSLSGTLDVFRDRSLLGQLTGIREPIQGAASCGILGGTGDCDGLGWAGDVAEILVYSRALTDAERLAVETYLYEKWLLALKAYDPDPPDGATDVLLGLPMWTSGHAAGHHELYIGATPELGPETLVFRGSSWPPADFVPPLWQPQTAYYWRVDEVEANRVKVHRGDVWTFVTAPSTAHRPDPRDGSRFVDPNVVPAWRPGLHMTRRDVYFGTDRQKVLDGTPATFRGRMETTTFDPGPLAPETTYFWRIDEIGPDDQTHPGSIWSFVTLGPGGGLKADYFDNMSRYGAPAVTRIDSAIDFTWGDGSPTRP